MTALGLGLICAFCGARLAYLNVEQVRAAAKKLRRQMGTSAAVLPQANRKIAGMNFEAAGELPGLGRR